MGDGYEVNHQELTEAANRTSAAGDTAQGIQQKVAAANGVVPQKAWGLLGNLTVYQWYESLYGTFTDHVQQMVTGVHNLAHDIASTAAHYKQNDSDIQDRFTEIESDLDGTAKPPTVRAAGDAGDTGGA